MVMVVDRQRLPIRAETALARKLDRLIQEMRVARRMMMREVVAIAQKRKELLRVNRAAMPSWVKGREEPVRGDVQALGNARAGVMRRRARSALPARYAYYQGEF